MVTKVFFSNRSVSLAKVVSLQLDVVPLSYRAYFGSDHTTIASISYLRIGLSVERRQEQGELPTSHGSHSLVLPKKFSSSFT